MENVNKQLLDALSGYDNIVRIVLNGLRRDYEERGLMIRKEFHDELSAAHAKACEAIFDAKEEMKAITAAEQAQQAEPVACEWQFRYTDVLGCTGDWVGMSQEEYLSMKANSAAWERYEIRELYAQPPAVAVPDEMESVHDTPFMSADTEPEIAYRDGWNACRAAMLAAARKGGA